jgi:hypothetical protein
MAGESTKPVRKYITYPHFNGVKEGDVTEVEIVEKNSDKHHTSNDSEF